MDYCINQADSTNRKRKHELRETDGDKGRNGWVSYCIISADSINRKRKSKEREISRDRQTDRQTETETERQREREREGGASRREQEVHKLHVHKLTRTEAPCHVKCEI